MNQLVVKANELNEAPMYKKASHLKMLAKIISVIRTSPEEEEFEFRIKDLMDDFNGSTENYQFFKKTAKEMMVVEFGDGNKNIDLEVVFKKISIRESGIIRFKIDPDFKPYILNLSKNFTQYYYENIARLNSSFSIRLYEILKQWEKVGHKKFSITALRYLLKIDDSKYKLYGDFKRWILEVGKKELKKKTDIYFSYEPIKTGRKITDIQFYIFKNQSIAKLTNKEKKESINYQENKQTSKPKNQELEQELKELGIDINFINEIFNSYEDELIKRNIEHIKREIERDNIKTSIGGYLRNALKGDYANQPTLFTVKDKIKSDKKVKEEKKKEENLSKEQEEIYKENSLKALKRGYEKYKKDTAYDSIKNDSAAAYIIYQYLKTTKSNSITFFEELEENELLEFAQERGASQAVFRNELYEKSNKTITFIEYCKSRNFEVIEEFEGHFKIIKHTKIK